jgi:membrane protease YdiL (CAAX protease family)
MRTRGLSDDLWAYFLLTFAISWTCWGLLIVSGLPGGSVHPEAPPPPPLALSLLVAGALAPSLASVLLTWRASGRAGLRALWRRMTQFRLGWAPYLVIVSVPLLVSLTRVAVHLARGGALRATPLLAHPALLIPFAAQVFAFGPLLEEPGWRGYALDRLLARRGFPPASLVLGGLHALWHLPLFFVVGTIQHAWGHPPVELAVFAAAVTGGAVIYTWLHVASGGSLWAAILFHATWNFGTSLLWTLYDGGTGDRLVMALVTVVLAAVLPRQVGSAWSGPRGRPWPEAGSVAP